MTGDRFAYYAGGAPGFLKDVQQLIFKIVPIGGIDILDRARVNAYRAIEARWAAENPVLAQAIADEIVEKVLSIKPVQQAAGSPGS